MRSISKRLSFVLVFLSVLLVSCFAFARGTYADGTLEVSFKASNSWQGASGACYQYDVSVKNTGSSAVSTWSFALDLGADGALDQAWSCETSLDGSVLTVTPLSWNANLGAGQSASGIGIVLVSPGSDRFSGTYAADPETGMLTKTGGPAPDPTVTPTPMPGTPTPTVKPAVVTPTPKVTGTPISYPSGSGMYGALKLNGVNLCSESGTPVQLRGVSTHGIAWYSQFVNSETFRYLRDDWGANLIRLAMYTEEYGGYCSGGDKAALENLIDKGVQACTSLGMYCIIDWHILADNDPTTNKEAALDFFARMSKKYSGYNNVLYEICNEPHWVDWPTIKAYADEVIPVIRENDPDAIIIVGTNTWSQDVTDPIGNPVADPYNVMYTLHFYAATHGQYLRDKAVSALNSGIPIFITEFSTCDASGSGAIDYDSAAAWRDLIMNRNLSYAGWNLANKDESSSIVISSCSKLLDWSENEISDTGKWLRALIRDGKALEPEIILPEDLDTLVLPDMLTTIEAEAFEGIKAECVIIPENVTSIGSRAFADSPNL